MHENEISQKQFIAVRVFSMCQMDSQHGNSFSKFIFVVAIKHTHTNTHTLTSTRYFVFTQMSAIQTKNELFFFFLSI